MTGRSEGFQGHACGETEAVSRFSRSLCDICLTSGTRGGEKLVRQPVSSEHGVPQVDRCECKRLS